MKCPVRLSVLLLLVFFGMGTSQGQQPQSHDGYWWTDQAEGFKLGFATGYALAMTNAADGAGLTCVADRNGGTLPDNTPLREAIKACLQSPQVVSLTFTGIRLGQLVEGADEFYKDFRNKDLKVEVAMRYVRDQLKGKTEKELADELAAWRQSANK
jgi:hypothetical protein